MYVNNNMSKDKTVLNVAQEEGCIMDLLIFLFKCMHQHIKVHYTA